MPMNFSTEILQELKQISPLLADMGKPNPFSVPEGYFDVLTVDILKNVNTTHTKAFTVPQGYFENLSSNILNKIKKEDNAAEELRQLSPMLYAIQNENVLSVPTGYFNQLENAVLENVLLTQAMVIPIKRNFVWKYAVAAVITGVIGLSSVMFLNKTENNLPAESNIPYTELAAQFKNESQLKEGIAKLSDEEIIAFLETTTNTADTEMLTQGIEEKELPAQNEYLLNDEVLQKYLNTTNANLKN
jgi:hypothetical protein